MDKKAVLLVSRIKAFTTAAIPFCFFALTLLVVGYLAWLNHNDFERVIIKQTQTQLLITALSEAQSIQKSVAGSAITTAGINSLIKHINDLEKAFAFVIDSDGEIIEYPYAFYNGKNILELIKGRIPAQEQSKLEAIMRKIRAGENGTDVLEFFSEDRDPKVARTMVAFSPINIGGKKFSLIVAMEYAVIENLIHKNARDNIISALFACAAFVAFGIILYRMRREKDKLLIEEEVSNIINKQLRSEIEGRKNP